MYAVAEMQTVAEAYRLRNIASILFHVRGYGDEAFGSIRKAKFRVSMSTQEEEQRR